jgi:hypothetical protein
MSVNTPMRTTLPKQINIKVNTATFITLKLKITQRFHTYLQNYMLNRSITYIIRCVSSTRSKQYHSHPNPLSTSHAIDARIRKSRTFTPKSTQQQTRHIRPITTHTSHKLQTHQYQFSSRNPPLFTDNHLLIPPKSKPNHGLRTIRSVAHLEIP